MGICRKGPLFSVSTVTSHEASLCSGDPKPKRDYVFWENHYEFTEWCANSGFELFFFSLLVKAQLLTGWKYFINFHWKEQKEIVSWIRDTHTGGDMIRGSLWLLFRRQWGCGAPLPVAVPALSFPETGSLGALHTNPLPLTEALSGSSLIPVFIQENFWSVASMKTRY